MKRFIVCVVAACSFLAATRNARAQKPGSITVQSLGDQNPACCEVQSPMLTARSWSDPSTVNYLNGDYTLILRMERAP